MAEKKIQKMRYSDEELSIIKNTFADNGELLFALRKHFLQLPKDVIDMQLLESLKDKAELLRLIRKAFLPTLDAKAPIHQMIDLWMTVEVKDKPVEAAYHQMQARKTLVDYLEQQLGKLESGKIEVDEVEDTLLNELCEMADKDMDIAYTDLVARNSMIGHTEMQIAQFQILAGQSAETVEETKARLGADSSK